MKGHFRNQMRTKLAKYATGVYAQKRLRDERQATAFEPRPIKKRIVGTAVGCGIVIIRESGVS